MRTMSDRDLLTPELPKRTPLEQAYLEIRDLCMRTDLMGKIRLDGGELSPEDQAENERKSAELARLRREIILRYGVEAHFLAALHTDAERYLNHLWRVADQITALKADMAVRDQ